MASCYDRSTSVGVGHSTLDAKAEPVRGLLLMILREKPNGMNRATA
jgi:hypothetical protein